MEKRLFNDGWRFALRPLEGGRPGDADWQDVEIPHDWLIWDTDALYRDGEGWYRKIFTLPAFDEAADCHYLRFDGVYMDTTVFLNGQQAFTWKYGYSTFTFDCTPFLRHGENEVVVRVVYRAPNSRWYSGAGIYRNVWLLSGSSVHLAPDGIYITPRKGNGDIWRTEIDAELSAGWSGYEVRHVIRDAGGAEVAAGRGGAHQMLTVTHPALWDIERPALYTLETSLWREGIPVQTVRSTFGYREIDFRPDSGFWLNGRRVKLQGVCQHHDLGCLGAAIHRDAMRRQLAKLREMGVNAIRTAHNMPAPELMELCDQMGFLVCSEAFDMWERDKTAYDYARFFPEWAERDVASWIRRDRNCPSVILWSIGNEIYDTHADERGLELTRFLRDLVRRHDPKGHALPTIGSNYMMGENAQRCADAVKLAGYNYAERLYAPHHAAHPDWVIYGSETCSVVQSRGIYHFPLRQPLLADDDLQCSALGNSATSWGARSNEACLLDDARADFSAGQFIWSGTDYIGEPTPYHTRNSYFGQIDTAGFEKDSFYIFQAAWTDWRTSPMVHLFPYWDFSPGQQVDVRVCSNAPEVELFCNGRSLGRKRLGLSEGKLVADYAAQYAVGELRAVAYGADGRQIAEQVRRSFGDAARLVAEIDRHAIPADGRSLAFITVSALDADGRPVDNATNRVRVRMRGAGRLVGLDNGDSTDPDPYKSCAKRLFSGKLLAVVAALFEPGEIFVEVSSPGLAPAAVRLIAQPAQLVPGVSAFLSPDLSTPDAPEQMDEIPVRKIELRYDGDFVLGPRQPTVTVKAIVLPPEATDRTLMWRVTNAAGIPANNAAIEADGDRATVTALGDGEIWLRCMSRSGTAHVRLISQLCFAAGGLGAAFLNPYGFVSGGLFTHTNAELTNGNERGVATPREGVSYIAFANVDFGNFGADTVTLPLFSLSTDPFPLEIWEGIPWEAGSEKLCEATYKSGSVWNTYLPETYTLSRRLKGITTVSFVFRQKVHFKGFSFSRAEKAFARLPAAAHSALYGDAFCVRGGRVEDIGNNVTLRFDGMDFTRQTPVSVTVWGRTHLENCSIQLRLRRPQEGADADSSVHILEFARAWEYTARTFPLAPVAPGMYDIEFVFLPGSRFDFDSFAMIHNDKGTDKR